MLELLAVAIWCFFVALSGGLLGLPGELSRDVLLVAGAATVAEAVAG